MNNLKDFKAVNPELRGWSIKGDMGVEHILVQVIFILSCLGINIYCQLPFTFTFISFQSFLTWVLGCNKRGKVNPKGKRNKGVSKQTMAIGEFDSLMNASNKNGCYAVESVGFFKYFC
jgi:hypothetical protein